MPVASNGARVVGGLLAVEEDEADLAGVLRARRACSSARASSITAAVPRRAVVGADEARQVLGVVVRGDGDRGLAAAERADDVAQPRVPGDALEAAAREPVAQALGEAAQRLGARGARAQLDLARQLRPGARGIEAVAARSPAPVAGASSAGAAVVAAGAGVDVAVARGRRRRRSGDRRRGDAAAAPPAGQPDARALRAARPVPWAVPADAGRRADPKGMRQHFQRPGGDPARSGAVIHGAESRSRATRFARRRRRRVAVLSGAALQSAVGFGFALVCAPLLYAAARRPPRRSA